jgi:hypothetical protein
MGKNRERFSRNAEDMGQDMAARKQYRDSDQIHPVDPFAKIVVNLITANGNTGEKIEFLASGQQFVAAGIHPDTSKPYFWPLGNPVDIPHDDLPYISAVEAQQLVDDIVKFLCRDFGYKRVAGRSSTTFLPATSYTKIPAISPPRWYAAAWPAVPP